MTQAEPLDDGIGHDPAVEPGPSDAYGPPEDAERAEPITIHIGFGFVAAALLVVAALVAGLVVGRMRQPAPAVLVVAPPTIVAVSPPTPVSYTQGLSRADDGQIAPGVVLEVSDAGHPLMNASAPDIAGTLLDGRPANLSGYVGQPLVVNFWATWCPPCRLEMPWLEQAYVANKDKGLVLLGVDAGEKVAPESALSLVQDFVAGAGMSFPILMPEDPSGAQYNYQVYGLPSTYFIGRDGKVTDVIRGAFPNVATLEARIAEYWRTWEASAPQ